MQNVTFNHASIHVSECVCQRRIVSEMMFTWNWVHPIVQRDSMVCNIWQWTPMLSTVLDCGFLRFQIINECIHRNTLWRQYKYTRNVSSLFIDSFLIPEVDRILVNTTTISMQRQHPFIHAERCVRVCVFVRNSIWSVLRVRTLSFLIRK